MSIVRDGTARRKAMAKEVTPWTTEGEGCVHWPESEKASRPCPEEHSSEESKAPLEGTHWESDSMEWMDDGRGAASKPRLQSSETWA